MMCLNVYCIIFAKDVLNHISLFLLHSKSVPIIIWYDDYTLNVKLSVLYLFFFRISRATLNAEIPLAA